MLAGQGKVDLEVLDEMQVAGQGWKISEGSFGMLLLLVRQDCFLWLLVLDSKSKVRVRWIKFSAVVLCWSFEVSVFVYDRKCI